MLARTVRVATTVGVLAISTWTVTGCSNPSVDNFEKADAACTSALRQKVSSQEQSDLDGWHSHVTQQGTGWQVEGQLPATGCDATCHVVPDPTDQLRGMRVASVQFDPPSGS